VPWRFAFGLCKKKIDEEDGNSGQSGRDYGFGERLRGDGRGRADARGVRRRARKAGRQRPPYARFVVRVCQDGARARYPGHHRRGRGRGPSAGHGGVDDDASGGGRSRQVAGAQRAGFAAFHRADACRGSGGHDRHQRGEERRFDSRFDTGLAGRGACRAARRVPRQTDRRRAESRIV